jgi:hypothetical protein
MSSFATAQRPTLIISHGASGIGAIRNFIDEFVLVDG